MGQVLRPDKFTLSKISSSVVSLLSGSVVTIGGQQEVLSSAVSLTISGLVANTLYMIYAVRVSGVVNLITSSNVNSVGPAGYQAWKLVGAFYADSSTALIDKLLPIDIMIPSRLLGTIYYPSNLWSRTGNTYGALTATSTTSVVDINNQHMDLISTTSTTLDISIKNMLPGSYEIAVTVPRVSFSAGATIDSSLSLFDGTSYLPFQTEGGLGGASSLYSGATLICPVTYTTANTRTFTVHGRVSTGSITIQTGQAAGSDQALATGRARLAMGAKFFSNFTMPIKDM